jgi:hypothetical protein
VPRQVLHDYQVVLAAPDEFLGFGDLLPVDILPASLPANELPVDGAIKAIVDPPSKERLLVSQALGVLIQRTDPRDTEYPERSAVARSKRTLRIKVHGHSLASTGRTHPCARLMIVMKK